MPLILPTRDTERSVIETAAQKFQRKPLARVRPMRAAIAAIMRAGIATIDHGIIRTATHANDWDMLTGAVPHLAGGRPLAKADTQTAPAPTIDDLINELAATFRESMSFATSFVPRFDVVDPRAVEFARERAGKLLTDLDARALANAREAVAFGIEHGRTVEQTARFLESSMYLPDRGMNAVENYFLALIDRVEQGDSIIEASRAAGADRALASTWANAGDIDTLTQRYADRWVGYVAETEARTMTIEASNGGLVEGWQEMADQGLFAASTATIVWYCTDDDITCPECVDLNGEEIALGDTFSDGSDYPPAHSACRCTVVLITPTGAEVDVGEGDVPEVPVEA